jgi:hemerythrin
MNLFEWKELYSVNIASVDQQHKVLVKWMNEFYLHHTARETQKSFSAMDNLLKYTVLHFQDEERMQEKYNFSDFENHKKHHARLLNLVTQLDAEFRKNPSPENGENLAQFLKGWL